MSCAVHTMSIVRHISKICLICLYQSNWCSHFYSRTEANPAFCCTFCIYCYGFSYNYNYCDSLFLLRLHLPISQHQSHSVLSPFPQITTVNWFACQLPFIFGNSPNSVKAPRAYVIKKGKGSLPKTVTRQRRDHDLNPGSSAPESQLHTNHSATEPRLRD